MKKKTKNPNAVALGRLGGLKGGKAKSEAKTAAARKNAARPRPNARKKTPPAQK